MKKGTDMPLPEGKRKSLYGEYTLIISDKYRKEGGFAKGFPEGGGWRKNNPWLSVTFVGKKTIRDNPRAPCAP